MSVPEEAARGSGNAACRARQSLRLCAGLRVRGRVPVRQWHVVLGRVPLQLRATERGPAIRASPLPGMRDTRSGTAVSFKRLDRGAHYSASRRTTDLGLTMNYDCRCIDCQCEPEQGSVADDVTTEAPSQRTATRHVRARKPCSRPPVAVEPPLGAHLLSPRWGYTHQGIYAGQGRVIHYAGLSRRVSRGPVEEVSLEAFARNRGIAIQRRDRLPFDEQEIVARARSRLGEDRYRIWSNNCEHFSRCGRCRAKAAASRWSAWPRHCVGCSAH